MTVLGVAVLLVLQWRRHRGASWHLPGQAQLAPRRKLAVWTGLIAATGLMALQLTPVLYNGRYASYFIEPWLMVATGTALGWLLHAHPVHLNRRRARWIMALLLLAVVLGANGITRPRGDATISVQFRCPAGSRLSWQGLELRRSTIGPAARDHLLHGQPFDPYLNEPLGMPPP